MGFLLLTSGSRFGQLSVFSRADVMLPLQESYREDGVSGIPPLVARVFHNKVIDHAQYLMDSTAKYFSYDFLVREAKEPVRERIPDMGVIYLFELPLLALGVIVSIRRRDRLGLLTMWWYVVGIAVISFAVDESPNIHRFFVVAFPLYVLIGIGIQYIIESIRSKKAHTRMIVVAIIVLLYLFSLGRFLHQLFVHQPTHEPYYRSSAFKILIPKLETLRSTYDMVVFSKGNSSPYIHVLFWNQYDPAAYQASGSRRDLDFVTFENLYFVPEDCPFSADRYWSLKVTPGKRTLFVNSGGCAATVNTKVIETIRWRNDMEAFQLVEYMATPSAEVIDGEMGRR